MFSRQPMEAETFVHTLKEVENSLDNATYRKGDWQQLVNSSWNVDRSVILSVKEDITRVSNKLHQQKGPGKLPFWPGYVFECIASFAGILCLFSEYPFVKLAGVVMLALGLQPLIKVTTGLLLGVSYAYTYFLNMEPRFKMNYGSYLCLPGVQRVALHLAGGVGTPLAMLMGFFSFRDYQLISNGLMLLFLVVALMQIGAFTAVWMGYPKVAGYLLENLTSPAKAAAELRRHQAAESHA